ncbi:hypothetical protein SXCC_03018 [Gluconacetobacter sp. SXCC-1]|nr:hypothetical protein SXCC_03018 [Gluconacetobacter sp. SXCC-1]
MINIKKAWNFFIHMEIIQDTLWLNLFIYCTVLANSSGYSSSCLYFQSISVRFI